MTAYHAEFEPAFIDPDKLAYPMAEAAALISVPETALRDAVTARSIRHRRYGKSRGVLFTREDLQLWLDSQIVEVQS